MLVLESARVRGRLKRRGAGIVMVKHPHAEEDAVRNGTLWRVAVLASLALLVSAQLCMLTTCVPRLTPRHAAAHACCRALPGGGAAKTPAASGAMPCDIALHVTGAPALALPNLVQASLHSACAALLAPPARVCIPRAPIDTGPPVDRQRSAPAGLRAPPQA